MDGCLVLTILGGVFEVFGLGLVAWEVTRLQRQEFGQPAWLLKVERSARRLFRRERSRTVHLHAMDAAMTLDTAMSLTVKRGPAILLEDKVRRLERIAEDLQRELKESKARLEQSIARVEQRVTGVETDIGRERQEEERTRKETIRRQITIQAVGTFLFFVGAVLSVLGNAVTC